MRGAAGLAQAQARLHRIDPVVVDVGLAALLTLLGIASLRQPLLPSSHLRPADAGGYALVVALCAPLVVRRRAPRAALAAVLVAATVLALVGYHQGPVGLPLLTAVFSLGFRHDLRGSAPLLVAVVAVMALSYAVSPDPVPFSDLASVIVYLVGAWGLGTGIRIRRTELARQAAAEERLRIARELHDVLAHSMSVVAVQSGVAAHLIDTNPALARAALETIATTSRTGLDELRRLLDVLRPDTQPAGELAPAPALADVPALADRLVGAGLTVRLHVDAAPAALPPALDLTAYRIVQEALTNAFRHAGPGAAVDVWIACSPNEVQVEITDDGRGTPDAARSGAGAGLIGMRERVALFGGDLDVGPANGGWRVRARLPTHGPRLTQASP